MNRVVDGSAQSNAYQGPTAARRTVAALSTYKGVLFILVVLSILFSVIQPGFRTVGNVANLAETNASLLIVSVGLTFPMLSGGFDLSVAGVYILSGIILVKLVGLGVPLGLAILIVIAGSAAFGAICNGILIGYLRVNFFIVTLGTLTITQGLSFQLTGGSSIGMYNESLLRTIGSGQVGRIPIDAVIAGAIAVASILLLRYTGFGRMIYAVGGNAEAARLSGIPTARVTMLTYAIAAGLAGVAGVVTVGRLESASATMDATIVLTAAAAVLIGGVAFGGGVGTIFGTILGVTFLGVLQSGLLITGVTSYMESVVTGIVLIGSVSVDKVRGGRGTVTGRWVVGLLPVKSLLLRGRHGDGVHGDRERQHTGNGAKWLRVSSTVRQRAPARESEQSKSGEC